MKQNRTKMNFRFLPVLFGLSFLILACQEKEATQDVVIAPEALETDLPLEKVNLPEGFKISVFAQGVENARSMALSPNGTLFVGTRGKGDVYALVDENGDYHAETMYTLDTGLNLPNGVAFKNGDLYVAEVNRILKYENIEANLENPPAPVVIYDEYPTERHHGWKFIAFGPDDKLYVPVGAPCNICE
ncbi:MAG: sorbosone dehydrogenase family protein, partial [Chloroflexota bacterium]